MDEDAIIEFHRAAGARMAGGGALSWPSQYGRGPLEEHLLVRRSAGLADLSSRLPPPPGLVGEGAPPETVALSSFLALSAPFASSLLLFEGPRAPSVLEALFGAPLPARGNGAPLAFRDMPVDLLRISLSGEDGCLLSCKGEDRVAVWTAILQAAAEAAVEAGPVGSHALESLAFEAGLPSPALLLGRAAPQPRPQAPGMKAVLVTVKAGLPEPGAELRGLGRAIGSCREGMYCPSLGLFACRALVEEAFSKPGTPLLALIRGGEKEGRVAAAPLYRGSASRS